MTSEMENFTEQELQEKYQKLMDQLQAKARRAFEEAGVPFTQFSGETDQRGFYRVPVSIKQAHPTKAVGLLAKLVEAFDPQPFASLPLHRVQLQYHDGTRKEPYDMYLATYPEKLGIVFIGLSRSEALGLLNQPELPTDPKEAFDQIWKQLYHTQDGWYSRHYDEAHRIGYIMHESKTLKLSDFH